MYWWCTDCNASATHVIDQLSGSQTVSYLKLSTLRSTKVAPGTCVQPMFAVDSGQPSGSWEAYQCVGKRRSRLLFSESFSNGLCSGGFHSLVRGCFQNIRTYVELVVLVFLVLFCGVIQVLPSAKWYLPHTAEGGFFRHFFHQLHLIQIGAILSFCSCYTHG